MKYFVSLILLLISLTAFGGCQQEEADQQKDVSAKAGTEETGKKDGWDNSILAKIDNKPVTIDSFNEEYRAAFYKPGQQPRHTKPEFEILGNYIEYLLLLEEAKKRDYRKDEEIRKQVTDFENKLIIKKLKDDVSKSLGAHVNYEMVENYYYQNLELFKLPRTYRFSHILLPTEEAAIKMLEQLTDGADFEELALNKSYDINSRTRGGDKGEFAREYSNSDFFTQVFSLEHPGELSEIIKSEQGFHIIKLTDLKPERYEDLYDVEKRISKYLKEELQNQAYEDFIKKLMADKKIKINENAIRIHKKSLLKDFL